MTLDTIDEEKVLKEFSVLVKDLNRSNGTLRRFLRARNHDLTKAEEMVRKFAEWREANDVDSALTKWKIADAITDNFYMEFPGNDKLNQCVFYLPLGSWPIHEHIQAGYTEDMYRNIILCMEKLSANIEKTGQDKFTFIVDMNEATMWKFAHYDTMQMVLTVFKQFEANMPERLHEAFVINVPSVVMYVWYMIKPLLTGNTLSKVIFLGSNPDKYMATFLDRMPASSIPKRLKKYL